jgi:hypothetical protein
MPRGLDWRWQSWSAMAARVEAWRRGLGERLAAADVEPGAAVAFPCPAAAPVPRYLAVSPLTAVTLDLGLQAAGFAPVPVAVTAEEGRGGVETWLRAAATRGAVGAVREPANATRAAEEEGGGALAAGGEEQDDVAGWTIRRIGSGRAGGAGAPSRGGGPSAAHAAADDGAHPSSPATSGDPTGPAAAGAPARARELHPQLSPFLADLYAAAETLVRQVSAVSPEPVSHPRREVAVTTAILDRPCERLLVAWSLLTGGALVLEPDPAARVATSVWARPTLFAGSPAEAAVLAREAEGWQREWQQSWTARLARRLRPRTPTLPFARLHTVVIDPTIPPPTPPDPTFWHDRGVTYRHLPDLLP